MAEYRSTGKELRKSPHGLTAGLLAAVLIVGAAYGVRRVLDGMVSLVAESSESDVELEVPEVSEVVPIDEDALKYSRAVFPERMIHSGPLVLVNSDYPIEDAEEGVVSVFEQRNAMLAVRDLEVYLLDETMLALNQLTLAFHEATGLADLLVKNGYVTKEVQKQLYDAGGAMPGCSEFESGYTLEFSLFQNGMFTDFTAEDGHKWILEHCAEYGFVQRYPGGKADITGVDDRPWVFRYVGTPHAWYMYENDLCLEEYIELLDRHPIEGEHLTFRDQTGALYEVYYVPIVLSADADADTEVEVKVPNDCQYTISGNNKHGFYVTMFLNDAEGAVESSAEEDETESEPEP